MGGYGSGGKNKSKGDITEYVRADSYDSEVRALVNAETETVKSGVYEAVFFKCPVCGKRARYLYDNKKGEFICRICLNVNYPCQQLPRHRWAVVKVLKILKKLDVDTENFNSQLELMNFEPEQPDYKMSENRFFKYQMQLLKYRLMWHDCVCGSVFFKNLDGMQERLKKRIKEAEHGRKD